MRYTYMKNIFAIGNNEKENFCQEQVFIIGLVSIHYS